jgi:type VI secretion system ImpM family protein
MKLAPSCFGKLPVHADFIRQNAGFELNDMDSWLQGGLLTLKNQLGDGWTRAFEAAPTVRFLRHYPDRKTLLVGVFAPSKGKAGRHYPFMVATAISDKAVYAQSGLIPLVVDDYLLAAEALIKAGGKGSNAKEVQAEITRLPSDTDLEGAQRRLGAALEQTPQEILLTASLGAWDQRRFPLYAALRDRLKSETGPVRVPTALASGVVALWFEVLRGSVRSGGYPRLMTWGQSSAGGDLRFVLRDPTGEDFAPLFIRDGVSGLKDFGASGGDLRSAQMQAGTLAEDGKRPVSHLVSTLLSG